ncbi:hypothetical protein GCM10009609_17530 [Pseudonocardia aurantiaca]|uniref:Uncharacterized protein n=1 Tax=Pseudonocardia aurantiaca TaxID=75290 RepID=A0ABW4FUC8_9PSEU
MAAIALIGTGCSNALAETGSGGDQNAPAGATPNPAERKSASEKCDDLLPEGRGR